VIREKGVQGGSCTTSTNLTFLKCDHFCSQELAAFQVKKPAQESDCFNTFLTICVQHAFRDCGRNSTRKLKNNLFILETKSNPAIPLLRKAVGCCASAPLPVINTNMKHKTFLTLIFSTVFFLSSREQEKNAGIPKRAIICLTYDDGLETQLSTVIPQLDSAGFTATFFLNSIQGSSQSDVIGQTPEAVLGWTKAAKKGHELANHTLFHPCPEKLGWQKSIAIETYTVDKIIAEIRTENSILALLDPNRKERSFAFPCNNFLIGDTDYIAILKKQGLVKYARAGGDSTSIISNFKDLNPMKVPSWHVWTGTTLEELISFAKKVKNAGGMGVLQLHGVGGQVFQISSETHRAFLAYLKAHPDEYWVTTFSNAMDFVTKRKLGSR
jgi:peptidoglycan/xylan/chitin deacetylase (PgdA/CDA1 family)